MVFWRSGNQKLKWKQSEYLYFLLSRRLPESQQEWGSRQMGPGFGQIKILTPQIISILSRFQEDLEYSLWIIDQECLKVLSSPRRVCILLFFLCYFISSTNELNPLIILKKWKSQPFYSCSSCLQLLRPTHSRIPLPATTCSTPWPLIRDMPELRGWYVLRPSTASNG